MSESKKKTSQKSRKKTKRTTGKKIDPPIEKSDDVIDEEIKEGSDAHQDEETLDKIKNQTKKGSIVVYQFLKTAVIKTYNAINYGVNYLRTKSGQKVALSTLVGIFFGYIPRFWPQINPNLVFNNLGLTIFLSIFLASPLVANKIGLMLVERDKKERDDNMIQNGILNIGFTFSFLILLLIYRKNFTSTALFFGFSFLTITAFVIGILIHTSETISSQEDRLNVDLVARALYGLSIISLYILGYLQPYLLNKTTRTTVDLIFVIFATILYLGLFIPFFRNLINSITRFLNRWEQREKGIRLSTYQMKQDYLEILENEGIIFVSQLENMSLEALSKIKGITKFDAAIILSTVFEMDEEELLEETIDED